MMNYFFKAISALFVVFATAGIIACGGSDGDDPITPDPPTPDPAWITVNGTTTGEHVFPGVFENGKSGLDYKIVFKISSNAVWTLSGKEDWLNVSPTSGNGNNIDLTVYPTSENNTDIDRKALLTLSCSDGASVSVEITQRAGKSVCYVRPSDEVALYDRICFEFYATPNVNNFQYLLLSENEYSRLTDKELTEKVMKEEECKYADDYLSYFGYDSFGNRIKENTTYYFVSLSSDKEGKYGVLEKVKVKTPAYKDANSDAWVGFENIYYGTSGFYFDTVKKGLCDTYHIIYGAYTETANPALFAFEINYYVKHSKKHWLADLYGWTITTSYPNADTFTCVPQAASYCDFYFAYGWGLFRDGSLSSDINGFQIDKTASSSSPQMRSMSNTEKQVNYTIKRSEVMSKVQ